MKYTITEMETLSKSLLEMPDLRWNHQPLFLLTVCLAHLLRTQLSGVQGCVHLQVLVQAYRISLTEKGSQGTVPYPALRVSEHLFSLSREVQLTVPSSQFPLQMDLILPDRSDALQTTVLFCPSLIKNSISSAIFLMQISTKNCCFFGLLQQNGKCGCRDKKEVESHPVEL